MNVNGYLLDPSDVDWATLLGHWHHLLPEEVEVWFVTRFGEPVLVLGDGSVHRLDIERAALERLADSRYDLPRVLDEGGATDIFMMELVDAAANAGMTLGPDQCYGFATPVILGGEYVAENVRVKSIAEYYAFLADLHEQAHDVPDGTPIRLRFEPRPGSS